MTSLNSGFKLTLMKKWYLFVCLIIFFGCDRPPLIKDYKIEKIGVGDSLLNIISKEEIEKQISNPEKSYYMLDPPNKFVPIIKKNNLDTYYELEIFVEPNDNKYIAKSIHGRMSNINLNSCLDKKSKIVLEFSDMFKNAKREEDSIFETIIDSKRTVYESKFTFKDGNQVMIQCYNYSELNIASNNHLLIGISSKEISDWLSTW